MPDSSDLVRVYNTALERGEPVRVSVAKYFRITVAAAASRIYRARKRGLLAPWKPRRVTVDAGELQGVVVPAPSPARRVARMDHDERQALRKAFDEGKSCNQCGGLHTRACPRVRRIAYTPSGGVAEVEFWPHGQWPTDDVIWPEDIEEIDEDED